MNHPYAYAIALAVLSLGVAALEALFPWRRHQRQLRPGLLGDLAHLVFNGHFLGVVLFGVATTHVLPVLDRLLGQAGLVDTLYRGVAGGWPLAVQIVVALVVVDLVQWGVHNLLHRVPWLWATHQCRHSIVHGEMDWIVSFRFQWTEVVVYRAVLYLPLAFFGFHPLAIFVHAVFGTLIGHLNHANLDLSWGPLRYVLNSPRMHIWHHDYDGDARTTVNFGIIFSTWDWIFGTAHMPDHPPARLGFAGVEDFLKDFLGQMAWPLPRLALVRPIAGLAGTASSPPGGGGGIHAPRGDPEGRTAERPTEIPARGWKQIAKGTWRKMSDDNVGFVAAALAYYSVFAVFPALAATLSLWGLFADPKVIEGQLAALSGSLPPDIAKMIQGQLSAVAGASGGALGFAAIVSVLVAVYSASKGMTGLMSGLNVVYAEKEGRGFVKRTLTSLALTFGGVPMVVVAIALLAVLPPVLEAVGLGGATSTLLSVGRWPLLALGMFAFLAVLYRYAPSRTKARWAWTMPGALLATAVWLVGSALFTLYVTMFGKFNETYGALGAAIVMLLWLWVSGYAFLLGGELNAELERHTERDTTAGPPRPIGERGAFMADHLPDGR